jgi:hypothetical protein
VDNLGEGKPSSLWDQLQGKIPILSRLSPACSDCKMQCAVFSSFFFARRKIHPNTHMQAQVVAAQATGDYPGIFTAAGKGADADVYVTSAAAITQNGEVLSGDGTGTRVNGLLRAKKVVVVASAQKIVPTLADGVQRLENYCVPLESARMRIEHGAPGSQLVFQVALAGAGYEPAGRRNIIIVTDEALGF